MPRKSTATLPLLTILYDGDDRLWRTRIALYKLEARRLGLDIAWRDLAREPEAREAFGIAPDAPRRSLYAVDGDGAVFAGTDALAVLWSALPSHRRLGYALATPAGGAAARLCARTARLLRRRGAGGDAGRAVAPEAAS
jgi:predicted DCC family thiol-disulfide oxidoreductase YuxK